MQGYTCIVTWAEDFIRDGMAVVEDALPKEFCEAVVTERLSAIGVVESDRETWRTGWHNLPASTVFDLRDVGPRAADALAELVGGEDALSFGGLPDNLIVNFPDPSKAWWAPNDRDAPGAGWHKDGDWFRHFLDSPEQGLLGIVFWRDVTDRQGATYAAMDSIPLIARFLGDHPEGVRPGSFPIREIVSQCRDLRPITGRQGTVIWAHPFLVHSASVNATDRLRIISNTSAMLREPLRFSGPGARTPIERVILDALGVDELDFHITHERERIESDRERRWREAGTANAQSAG